MNADSTELIESIMYLYQATRDPFLLKAGVDIVEAIEHIARTSCGYATVSTAVGKLSVKLLSTVAFGAC